MGTNNNTPSKLNLNDLTLEVQELNKRYLISDFQKEMTILFRETFKSDMNAASIEIDEMLNRPKMVMDIEDAVEISEDDFRKYIEQYNVLKTKYKFDEYMKEGHALRRKFLKGRKEYIFNSAKFIDMPASRKVTSIEKLHIDYNEQYLISQWLDRMLKKIYPYTLKITYEDLSGKIKEAEISHQKVAFYEDGDGAVECPLIDRILGISLFDSFLLHSFYNKTEKAWQYFPIKFIINIHNKDDIAGMMREDGEDEL